MVLRPKPTCAAFLISAAAAAAALGLVGCDSDSEPTPTQTPAEESAAGTTTETVRVWDLDVGNCWTTYRLASEGDSPVREGVRYELRACNQPHSGEVFGLPTSEQCGIRTFEDGELVDRFDVSGALSQYVGVPADQLGAWAEDNVVNVQYSGEADPQGLQACSYSLVSAKPGDPLVGSYRASPAS